MPAHPFSILLARPTTTAVTASVIASTGLEAYFEYGASSGSFDRRTPTRRLAAGEPELFLLDGLPRHSAGSYRFRHRNPASEDAPFASEPPESFQLLRSPGSAFTFTIQADSHLDANVDPAVYLRALENARADRPDFHVDLGDTFMTDKYPKFQEARPQYDAQRWYLGQIGRTAPVFMVLGNHDGEAGYAASGATSIAAWSYAERTRRFPPPLVGQESLDLYRGRTAFVDGRGSNFYTYTWGDATFVVLDPFWPTTERVRGNGRRGVQALANVNTDANWTRTLGREQYDWLATTLATSRSRYLFVFLHHLVGGFGREARGGVESSIYFEWGGKNADGSEGFAAHRPGWPRPIHDLLRDARVSAVFHGHDHLYVRNERDGVVYQCVPQPGNPAGGTRSAEDYGYRSGTILGSPGHLRVRVTPTEATIEYLRSSLDAAPSRRRDPPPNAAVVHRYALAPRTL